MIELTSVSKRYSPEITALPPTSLHLRRGELVWISGASGSGKSTLLGIASLLIVPTEGTVSIDGTMVQAGDEEARTALRRDLFGIIPQSALLFSDLSAVKNVRVATPDISEDAARAALSKVGLSAQADQPVRELSGGQQQRVSIARALAKKPQALCADEITSALDDDNASAVWEILRTAADSGCTVVVASHDARIRPFADRCVRVGAH